MSQGNADEEKQLRRTASLIREFQGGDDGAFRLLYELHAESVLRSAARALGHHLTDLVDPEDILQEAFVIACQQVRERSAEEFRTTGRFRHMLARIARNVVVDTGRLHSAEKRSWKRKEPLGDGHDHPSAETHRPSFGARTLEAQQVAEAVLLEARPEDRQIIDLRDNLGLEYTEIAEVLGLGSPAAAKLRCTRARRKWEMETRRRLGEP